MFPLIKPLDSGRDDSALGEPDLGNAGAEDETLAFLEAQEHASDGEPLIRGAPRREPQDFPKIGRSASRATWFARGLDSRDTNSPRFSAFHQQPPATMREGKCHELISSARLPGREALRLSGSCEEPKGKERRPRQ